MSLLLLQTQFLRELNQGVAYTTRTITVYMPHNIVKCKSQHGVAGLICTMQASHLQLVIKQLSFFSRVCPRCYSQGNTMGQDDLTIA